MLGSFRFRFKGPPDVEYQMIFLPLRLCVLSLVYSCSTQDIARPNFTLDSNRSILCNIEPSSDSNPHIRLHVTPSRPQMNIWQIPYAFPMTSHPVSDMHTVSVRGEFLNYNPCGVPMLPASEANRPVSNIQE